MQAGDETAGGSSRDSRATKSGRFVYLRGKLWDLAKKDLDWLIA